jgi:hypothetical protein
VPSRRSLGAFLAIVLMVGSGDVVAASALHQLRARALRHYRRVQVLHPSTADLEYVASLFEGDHYGNAKDVQRLTEKVLLANQSTPISFTNVPTGDLGFAPAFRDGPVPRQGRQSRHFFGAVAAGLHGVPVSSSRKRGVVPLWFLRGEVRADFERAVRLLGGGGTDTEPALAYLRAHIVVDEGRGNSYADLGLSVVGYWLGGAIRAGKFSSGEAVGRYLRRVLGE